MKKNSIFKYITGIVIGILLTSIIGVYAVTAIIDSKEVSYDNENSNGNYDNVQDSIDELYKKAKALSGEQDTIYTEGILNGADPVLGDGMIPITLEDDGTVKYANLYTPWYKYASKRWANAVILVDNPSQSYKIGDTILEKDIESYFVWVPRYKYKIWNLSNTDDYVSLSATNYEDNIWRVRKSARIIDVVFENKSTSTSTTQEVGKYYTHPAFTSFGVSGLWIGKFEIGGNENSIIVKPNVTSWRSATVGTFWNTMFNYKRNLDSHMIKNTEWGAVAYLSHSAYGIGNEVNINNNSDCITGYSAAANTDQSSYEGTYGNTNSDLTLPYNTPTGYLASTTGNITGIYDMNGGSHEYVAGYLDSYGITNSSGVASGLTTADLAKTQYFDKYTGVQFWYSFSKRILGDATGEMGPFYEYKERNGTIHSHNAWYGDSSFLVEKGSPWFIRGGYYDHGTMSGQFYFSRHNGGSNSTSSTRLVLAVK